MLAADAPDDLLLAVEEARQLDPAVGDGAPVVGDDRGVVRLRRDRQAPDVGVERVQRGWHRCLYPAEAQLDGPHRVCGEPRCGQQLRRATLRVAVDVEHDPGWQLELLARGDPAVELEAAVEHPLRPLALVGVPVQARRRRDGQQPLLDSAQYLA